MNKNNFFKDKTILKSLPIKRAAYSDRASWLVAECSQLAYESVDEYAVKLTLLKKSSNLFLILASKSV